MIKKLFLISLLNFVFVLGVVFVAKATITPKAPESLTESVITPTVTAPSATPTLIPTATVSVAQTITPTTDPLAGHCLVYVDGLRYDITEFRNLHSGGNIFQCGTNMSDIFHGQHPDSFLGKIDKYRI